MGHDMRGKGCMDRGRVAGGLCGWEPAARAYRATHTGSPNAKAARVLHRASPSRDETYEASRERQSARCRTRECCGSGRRQLPQACVQRCRFRPDGHQAIVRAIHGPSRATQTSSPCRAYGNGRRQHRVHDREGRGVGAAEGVREDDGRGVPRAAMQPARGDTRGGHPGDRQRCDKSSPRGRGERWRGLACHSPGTGEIVQLP